MNSKERMLVALHGGTPDRLPASVHQWQKYHLDTCLGGISDLEAFKMFGLDASIQYFGEMGQFSQDTGHRYSPGATYVRYESPEWREEVKVVRDEPDDRVYHHTVTTPLGALTYKTAGNRMTTWISEYMLKQDDDLRRIRYLPVPELNRQAVARVYDSVGDAGILRGFVWGDQAGCWQHACCLIDVQDLILACYDKPDWVHELLGILLEKKLRFVDGMKGARFDVIETGGGAGSSTVISPKIHEQFCLPYDRQVHDAVHAVDDYLITYHTCGGARGIEDLIVANGCDISETMPPLSIGGNHEPWEMKAKIGKRVALIGGMDQFNTLTTGTREEIRAAVHMLFEKVGYEGGYVMSCADHFFETPSENLRAYGEAARECVY